MQTALIKGYISNNTTIKNIQKSWNKHLLKAIELESIETHFRNINQTIRVKEILTIPRITQSYAGEVREVF